jgi:hypothetical protein
LTLLTFVAASENWIATELLGKTYGFPSTVALASALFVYRRVVVTGADA